MAKQPDPQSFEAFLNGHCELQACAFMVAVNHVPTIGMVLSVHSLELAGAKPREFLLLGNEITPLSGTATDIKRAVGAA